MLISSVYVVYIRLNTVYLTLEQLIEHMHVFLYYNQSRHIHAGVPETYKTLYPFLKDIADHC